MNIQVQVRNMAESGLYFILWRFGIEFGGKAPLKLQILHSPKFFPVFVIYY
jgi:hypothetical protein